MGDTNNIHSYKTLKVLLTILVRALLVFFVFFRLILLDADPPSFLPSTVIGDEGYWMHNARIHKLFQKTFTDDFMEDIMVAPILSFLLRISFSVFGVGFWQARVVPAIFGIGTLVLFYMFMKGAGIRAAFIATLLLSSNFLFFSINRIVMGESISLFFFFLSLLLFIRHQGIASGISFALSILSKSNAVLLFPVFVFVALADIRRLWKTCIACILSAIIVVGIAGLFLWVVSHQSILETYISLSGTAYVPKNEREIIHNVKSFVRNPFWLRDGVWLLSIPATFYLLENRLMSSTFLASLGIIFSQILLVAPISNQGSDHRFVFLLVGLIMMASFKIKRTLLLTIATVVILNLISIRQYFSSLTFSLRDASKALSTFSKRGEHMTGFFSHELVIENSLYPVYWTPGHSVFSVFNADIERFKPGYLIIPTVVDGRDGTVFTSEEQRQLGVDREFIQHIRVLPHKEKYQFEADLYKIYW